MNTAITIKVLYFIPIIGKAIILIIFIFILFTVNSFSFSSHSDGS